MSFSSQPKPNIAALLTAFVAYLRQASSLMPLLTVPQAGEEAIVAYDERGVGDDAGKHSLKINFKEEADYDALLGFLGRQKQDTMVFKQERRAGEVFPFCLVFNNDQATASIQTFLGFLRTCYSRHAAFLNEALFLGEVARGQGSQAQLTCLPVETALLKESLSEEGIVVSFYQSTTHGNKNCVRVQCDSAETASALERLVLEHLNQALRPSQHGQFRYHFGGRGSQRLSLAYFAALVTTLMDAAWQKVFEFPQCADTELVAFDAVDAPVPPQEEVGELAVPTTFTGGAAGIVRLFLAMNRYGLPQLSLGGSRLAQAAPQAPRLEVMAAALAMQVLLFSSRGTQTFLRVQAPLGDKTLQLVLMEGGDQGVSEKPVASFDATTAALVSLAQLFQLGPQLPAFFVAWFGVYVTSIAIKLESTADLLAAHNDSGALALTGAASDSAATADSTAVAAGKGRDVGPKAKVDSVALDISLDVSLGLENKNNRPFLTAQQALGLREQSAKMLPRAHTAFSNNGRECRLYALNTDPNIVVAMIFGVSRQEASRSLCRVVCYSVSGEAVDFGRLLPELFGLDGQPNTQLLSRLNGFEYFLVPFYKGLKVEYQSPLVAQSFKAGNDAFSQQLVASGSSGAQFVTIDRCSVTVTEMLHATGFDTQVRVEATVLRTRGVSASPPKCLVFPSCLDAHHAVLEVPSLPLNDFHAQSSHQEPARLSKGFQPRVLARMTVTAKALAATEEVCLDTAGMEALPRSVRCYFQADASKEPALEGVSAEFSANQAVAGPPGLPAPTTRQEPVQDESSPQPSAQYRCLPTSSLFPAEVLQFRGGGGAGDPGAAPSPRR